MLRLLLATVLIGATLADYSCICNYNAEKKVYADKDTTSTEIGVMYEFDCKPAVDSHGNGHWLSVAFSHQIGYIEKDMQTETQMCPGDPDPADKLLDSGANETTTALPQTSPMSTPMMTTPASPEPSTAAPMSTTTTGMMTTTVIMTTTTIPTTARPTTPVATTLMPSTPIQTTTAPMMTTVMPTTAQPVSTVSSNPYVPGVTYGCDPKYYQLAQNDSATLFTYGQNCYELVRVLRTWTDAEKDCVNKGGHLATVNSAEEDNAIYHVVTHYHGASIWIGFNDRDHEDHFQWSSGSPVNYTNFYGGHMNIFIHGSEDCVAIWLRHRGEWEDIRCSTHHGYVCQFDGVPTTNIVPQATNAPITYSEGDTHLCPLTALSLASQAGTVLVQRKDSCYELLHNKLTWRHAESLCRQAGGHLVTINDADEQAYVQDVLMHHLPKNAVWIGLRDSVTEGDFQWISGDSLTYTNWVANHSDNGVSHTSADCAALIPYQGGQWDDVTCGSSGFFGDTGETHPGFCEYNIKGNELGGASVLVG